MQYQSCQELCMSSECCRSTKTEKALFLLSISHIHMCNVVKAFCLQGATFDNKILADLETFLVSFS